MWRNTVVMAIRDIQATGIVAMAIRGIQATGIVAMAMDIVATMAILIMVSTTEEDTTTNTIGLITEAIMDTHMVVATTAGIIEGSGLASIKDGRRRQAEERGSGGASNYVVITSQLQYECSSCLHTM